MAQLLASICYCSPSGYFTPLSLVAIRLFEMLLHLHQSPHSNLLWCCTLFSKTIHLSSRFRPYVIQWQALSSRQMIASFQVNSSILLDPSPLHFAPLATFWPGRISATCSVLWLLKLWETQKLNCHREGCGTWRLSGIASYYCHWIMWPYFRFLSRSLEDIASAKRSSSVV